MSLQWHMTHINWADWHLAASKTRQLVLEMLFVTARFIFLIACIRSHMNTIEFPASIWLYLIMSVVTCNMVNQKEHE